MNYLRNFEEFLEIGIIKRRTPDFSRAKSLVQEAEKRKRFLKELSDKIKITDDNANYFIENVYDVLIELIRAKLFIDGFKSSGEGAHEAEVSYLRKLNFPEADVKFMNSLRYFRNGIKYYGKSFDKEYAKRVLFFLDKVYLKLKEFVRPD